VGREIIAEQIQLAELDFHELSEFEYYYLIGDFYHPPSQSHVLSAADMSPQQQRASSLSSIHVSPADGSNFQPSNPDEIPYESNKARVLHFCVSEYNKGDPTKNETALRFFESLQSCEGVRVEIHPEKDRHDVT